MQRELLQSLMRKQLLGSIGEAEREQLQQYVQDESNRETVSETLALLLAQQQADPSYDQERYDPLLNAILTADKPAAPVVLLRRRAVWWWAAAAIVLAIAGAAVYYGLPRKSSPAEVVTQQIPINDALPGQDGAVLILANDQRIVLDSAHTGALKAQGIKASLENGMLVYESVSNAADPVTFNTMHTPRGRQFRVILPDGTRVWLNAASSITYPTRFENSVRLVSVTGEAYFEVAKNPAKPFHVNIHDEAKIEVLGTHFNVNSYSKNGIAATLLEGSVKMSSSSAQEVLKPGEQAVAQAGKLKRYQHVDVAAVVAWKEGLFHFNNTSFPVVMAELERWYDVEVVYEDGVPPGAMSGEFPRTLLLSEVLRILELSGIHYKIENKKLIVSAKG
ncbi:FecR domain-containing protein [Paraflavitalea sp. CAU 1676]|uniref:FecR family protein n=1 Tax=Paraflavitalea sp. CAU 1676 TaxID=3032598 RepID=UPI0023DA01EB|nr:FecR domain-containing protein [Paraflavitalea sp. CAU 1676]MDF2192825.1 FecR domain-containing protein [Paraflavitalea sp. CAU 1676]